MTSPVKEKQDGDSTARAERDISHQMMVLTWGVHHSITRLLSVTPPAILSRDDFKAFGRVRIDNEYLRDDMPRTFQFKEYMPLVFHTLRERFGIDEKSFLRSFSVDPTVKSQSGRSGATFFLTNDKMYFIKTMSREETKLMRRIMTRYHDYILATPTTLLPQYLAMYKLTISGKKCYCMVLRNVFSSQTNTIHKHYDLKGSRVDREAAKDCGNDNPTLKDNDLLKSKTKVYIGIDRKVEILEKIHKDVHFLSSLHLMDYSLLIGVHEKTKEEAVLLEDGIKNGVFRDTSIRNQDGSPIMKNGLMSSTSHSASDGDVTRDIKMLDVTSPVASVGRARGRQMTDPTGGSIGRARGRLKSLEADMNRAEAELKNVRFPKPAKHDGPDPEHFAIASRHETIQEVYYIGIIDVLCYYGNTKKAAHVAKTVKHGADAEISTVKPDLYATRFKHFMERIFE